MAIAPETLPYTTSPDEVMEISQCSRPRQYAKTIFLRYPKHERSLAVDRTVPVEWRAMVREYLADWESRKQWLLSQNAIPKVRR